MKYFFCNLCSNSAGVTETRKITPHDLAPDVRCPATGGFTPDPLFDSAEAAIETQARATATRAEATGYGSDVDLSELAETLTPEQRALLEFQPWSPPVKPSADLRFEYLPRRLFPSNREYLAHCREVIDSRNSQHAAVVGSGARVVVSGTSVRTLSGGLPGLGRRR